LMFNAHYTTYNYERNQSVISNFFSQDNNFISASAFNTDANQDTNIFAGKLDYSLPINDNSNFEAGLKFSGINTESDLTQFDVNLNTGEETLDEENTDAFDYEERIYAAYANYTNNSEKWNLSLGLRVEQTNVDGFSPLSEITTVQDYLEWFPNASLQYNISEDYNIYVNYKRSIVRPSYSDLNPFQFFLNQNYVVSGNPNLVPTFIDHGYVGTTLLGGLFTIEAYYKNYDGAISEIPRQNNDDNIIQYISVNFDTTIEYGFDFLTYFNVNDRWSIYAVTSFYNWEEETDFGRGVVSQNQWSNYSELQNDFTFLKDNSLNATLTLTWSGKNLQGFQIVEDRLFSEFTVSKSIFKKKGVISLSAGDLFNYQDPRSRVRYQNQFSSANVNRDNRFVKLGFRYKFGNTRLKTNERTINTDERNRLDKKE
ncbi:MAG: outer membrane beta-barrel family protein, partial [Bacteroidota bacterium]